MIRIAILISGRGSNMLRLAEMISAIPDRAQIVLVAANNDCDGLVEAAALGLPTTLVDRQQFADRSSHESALAAQIEDASADWILLAGYMAILSATFIARFPHRILNIHPSLLPELKGLDTHARALAANRDRHGATVHMVTPQLDDGPILLQAGLTIGNGETEQALASRVLALEHALYPFVVMSLADEVLTIRDGRPVWRDAIRSLRDAPPSIGDVLKPAVIWP